MKFIASQPLFHAFRPTEGHMQNAKSALSIVVI